MKKRKIIANICLAVFCAVFLSSCEGGVPFLGKDKENQENVMSQTPPMASEEEIEAAGFTSYGPGEKPEADDSSAEAEQGAAAAFEEEQEAGRVSSETGIEDDAESLLSGLHHARIEVKDFGAIDLELDADIAPVTVTNFVKLAKEGFYDGLTFHRIVDGVMIQGGDPLANNLGGSADTIVGEFAANGVENSISHVRGTISMARNSDPDSASSQFFIMQEDALGLDGRYAGFGHVTDGMAVVDDIVTYAGSLSQISENGLLEVKSEQPVIESVTILD